MGLNSDYFLWNGEFIFEFFSRDRSFFEGERIIKEARQRGQAPQAERQQEQQENDQVCMKLS